jgi:alcohol dehydrogenase class IV
LVHAVEAATSQRSNAIAQSYALQAVRLIRGALPAAVAAPDNLSARLQMQEAACLAGLAIDQSGTGLAHNIGHALGTVAHLPHAVAVALAMQATLAWSIAGAPARYQPIADALHPGSSSTDLPELYAALLAAVDFAHARPPSPTPSAEALLDSMRSAENQPMLANNARVADPSELAMLAHQVVALL